MEANQRMLDMSSAHSFQTARKSLASRLKFDASWDKAAWSLRAAILLQFLALLQWFLFSSALTSPLDMRLGPVCHFLVLIGLLLISWHRGYWQKQLEFYALEAKYLGAYD